MDDFNFGMLSGEGSNGEATFSKGKVFPRFYARPVHNAAKSREAGSPIYDQVDFVEILTAGERDTLDREVTEEFKHRWRSQWNAYKEAREQVPDGTLLVHLFPHQPDTVEMLKANRFHTVEQLAEASDTALQSIAMGAYDIQAKAKKFLEGAKDGGRFATLEKRAEDAEARSKKLEEEMAELKALVAAQAAAKADEPTRAARR